VPDLFAEFFAGDGVAHFVAGLDEGEADVEEDEVVGGQETVALLGDFSLPVRDLHDGVDAEGDEDGPNDQADGGEDPADEGEDFIKDVVGIPDGDARKHDVHEGSW